MNMQRQTFIMGQEDFDTIIEACKPVPLLALQCGTPPSPQENANNAWKRLGKKMGFDGLTVRPEGSNQLKFTAIPKET